MKRSSWIVLGGAAIVLAVSFAFYLSRMNRLAPALTPGVVAGILEEGKRSIGRGDVDGIMRLMAPDARILGRRPETMRALIGRAVDQVLSPLTAKTGPITLKSEGAEHLATFDLEIGQENKDMRVVYYPGLHVRLRLQKVRTPQWWGLYSVEDWRIAQFDCEPPIETTPGG